MRLIVFLLVAATVARTALSQAPPGPVVTDRPDQTESTTVIAPGYLQLEVGWTMARDRVGALQGTHHAAPQALARVGLGNAFELRLGFAGWLRSTLSQAGVSSTENGVGDLDLGVKYRLVEGAGIAPSVALLGALTLPTGEDGLGVERVDPEVRLILASDLGERVGLGYNMGVTWSSERGAAGSVRTAADLLYTLSLAVSLTQRLGAFAESFGAVSLNDAGESEHLLDGGFTLLLRDNLQLDASGGVGLNAAAGDWFVGAGVTVRIPR